MDTITENLIQRKALEISNWIQDAVGDLAYEMHPQDIRMCYGNKWAAKIKKAKRDGVIDLRGWLADEMYSDCDILQDLCGDRLFDAATEICGTARNPYHSLHFIAIAEKMKENAHTALVIALNKLIANRQTRLEANEISPEDLEAAAEYHDRLMAGDSKGGE